MKTLVAYIGRYRVEGNQWVTSVQTAWAPEWVGTEQRRTIEINGDYANVITPCVKCLTGTLEKCLAASFDLNGLNNLYHS